MPLLTIISLCNSILNASSFGKIGDFSPIFIWICIGAESATGSETSRPHMGHSFRTVVRLVHSACDD